MVKVNWYDAACRFLCLEEREQRRLVKRGLEGFLTMHKGNWATVTPVKVASFLDLPVHPVILSLVRYHLDKLRSVTVTRLNGSSLERVVWARKFKRRSRKKVVYVYLAVDKEPVRGG
ncbi:MAG: hypothetical protein QXZ31_08680 [Thermofilaceae archaeon]